MALCIPTSEGPSPAYRYLERSHDKNMSYMLLRSIINHSNGNIYQPTEQHAFPRSGSYFKPNCSAIARRRLVDTEYYNVLRRVGGCRQTLDQESLMVACRRRQCPLPTILHRRHPVWDDASADNVPVELFLLALIVRGRAHHIDASFQQVIDGVIHLQTPHGDTCVPGGTRPSRESHKYELSSSDPF